MLGQNRPGNMCANVEISCASSAGCLVIAETMPRPTGMRVVAARAAVALEMPPVNHESSEIYSSL